MATFEDAATAAQHGDKRRARTILREIMKQEPRNLEAWLLFAEVSEKPDDSIYCLRQVLKLDPGNTTARERLVALGRADLAPADVIAVPAPNGPAPAEAGAAPAIASEPANDPLAAAPTESQPSTNLVVESAAPPPATKVCPYCAETIQAQAVYCRYCHRDLRSQAPLTVDKHFGGLGFVAILLQVIGVFTVLGAILGALAFFALSRQVTAATSTPAVSSFAWLVPLMIAGLGTINGVIFFAFGELINLLINLEANTRLTAGILQRQAK